MQQQVKAELVNEREVVIRNKTIYSSNLEICCEIKNFCLINPESIRFESCIIGVDYFPTSQSLFKFLPELRSLTMTELASSQFTVLPQHFIGFDRLTSLDMSHNFIEELPANLFQHIPNIQFVSFAHNKIRFIDENILEPLRKLAFFDLRYNDAIDAVFISFCSPPDSNALTEFKEAIKRCKPVQKVWEIVDELREELVKHKKIIAEQTMRVILYAKMNDNQSLRTETLQNQLREIEAYQKFDFIIKVNGMQFRVQKKLLADNSPFLANLIRNNEETDTMELKGISEGAFEAILNFMAKKALPPTANFIEIYSASGRLQMKELMDLSARMLMGKVTRENALEILNLCQKYKNSELEKRAFDELKKKYA